MALHRARDTSHMDLHSAGNRVGVCCAPHGAAAEAGRTVFIEGGNAIEAMIAMAATIAAVYPHMNHIGGDGFWLVREPNGRVRAIMATGPAGANAAIMHAREGYTVTRSQARLSEEKLAELKDLPGFAAQFLPEGKPPKAGDV